MRKFASAAQNIVNQIRLFHTSFSQTNKQELFKLLDDKKYKIFNISLDNKKIFLFNVNGKGNAFVINLTDQK